MNTFESKLFWFSIFLWVAASLVKTTQKHIIKKENRTITLLATVVNSISSLLFLWWICLMGYTYVTG